MHCGFANCEIELVPGTYEVSIHQECLYCATYGLELFESIRAEEEKNQSRTTFRSHPKRSSQWPPLNAASPENVSLHKCLRMTLKLQTSFSPFYHSSLCSSQALAPKTVPQIFLWIKHETVVNPVTP